MVFLFSLALPLKDLHNELEDLQIAENGTKIVLYEDDVHGYIVKRKVHLSR